MGIRDDQLEGGLFEAFKSPQGESALEAIQRLHRAGSSLLLREVDEGATPVLLKRDETHGDSRFQILGEIARGGIGVVYKGRDKDLNRDIALKVLRPEFADRDDVVQRFIEEAQVGGQLQHPGIVPIYGIGLQDDGRPSFAMKLIKGKTLAELLDNNRRGVDLLAVFEQVAQTIAYAHSRGVIHRDLKPANVMVGAFGEVQIVDWGFAKVLGHEELKPRPEQTMIATVRSGSEGSGSIAGSVMGTPAYMPPEQALGQIEDLDERSDVFALGAILCEILTGKPPYEGEQKDQLIAATQCLLEPARARLDDADAPDGLKDIVRGCLQPRMADRPKDAQALADRLAEHFTNVEERAKQSELDALKSEAQAAREQTAKRRNLVLAGLALLLVVAGGGGYFSWKRGKDARETAAAKPIAAALRAAREQEGLKDWPAAVAAAQKAVDIAKAEGGDDTEPVEVLAHLQSKQHEAEASLRRRNEDDGFLAKLERIRGQRGAFGQQSYEALDRAYEAAFNERFGSFEAAEKSLADSPHAEAYAANLGFWCSLRKTWLRMAGWEPIDRLARRIEPSHAEVRDAVIGAEPAALLAIAKERDDLPPALAAQVGLALIHCNHARVAWDFLQRYSRRAPGDYWIHVRLTLAAKKLDDLDGAERHATAALATRPKSVWAWRNLAGTLYTKGDFEGAFDVYRRLLEIDPGSALNHHDIGAMHGRKGDHKQAIAAYRRAISIDPEFVYSHEGLGAALYAQGDVDGALASVRRAIAIDPDFARAHMGVGVVLDHKGDLDGAIAAYRQAIELDPTRKTARRNLMRALRKRYRPALRKVLKGAEPPAGAAERLGFADLCYAARSYPHAVRFYRLAFEADKTLLAANGYTAGCAAVKAGERAQALTWLRGYLDGLTDKNRAAALRWWLRDDALKGTENLGKEWQELWKRVRK